MDQKDAFYFHHDLANIIIQENLKNIAWGKKCDNGKKTDKNNSITKLITNIDVEGIASINIISSEKKLKCIQNNNAKKEEYPLMDFAHHIFPLSKKLKPLKM